MTNCHLIFRFFNIFFSFTVHTGKWFFLIIRPVFTAKNCYFSDGLPQNIFTFQNIVSLCKSKRSTVSFPGSLDRGLLLCDTLSRDISIF